MNSENKQKEDIQKIAEYFRDHEGTENLRRTWALDNINM